MRQIDLASRTIRLEVGETKNGEGRLVKMTEEVYTLIAACVQGKSVDDFVFTREDGSPIRDFRKLWANVCNQAGVPGLLLHDLRRTGVRNLRRLGVAESVAMKISGHKTSSVFRRYDITDEADLADAAARLDAKRAERTERELAKKDTEAPQSIPGEFRHSSDIVGPISAPLAADLKIN